MEDHERELEEWRHYIGRAILAFAEVEFITVKLLTHVPRDKIIDGVQHLPFARRIDFIIEALGARQAPPKGTPGLTSLLRSAKGLAEYRNVIAHNPVMWHIFENEAGDDTLVERAIISARGKEKQLDLDGLKKLTAEVESLIMPMYTHVMGMLAGIGEARANARNADA